MSNARFLLTNLLELSTTSLLSGAGGGAHDLVENPPYTTAMLTNPDRFTEYQAAASPASPILIDYDLGSAKFFGAGALLNFDSPATLPVTTVEFSSQASSYSPGGAWTLRGTITLGVDKPVDSAVLFASASARYLRTAFTVFDQFTLGRLWIGPVLDLGSGGSPPLNMQFDPMESAEESDHGPDVLEDYGRRRFTSRLRFSDVPDATFQQFNSASLAGGRIVYIDPLDRVWEVRVKAFSHPLKWSPPLLWDLELELRASV